MARYFPLLTSCPIKPPTAAPAAVPIVLPPDIRSQVETAENIGKFVVIDLESGSYAVDPLGFDAARSLRTTNPKATLFAIKIGYNASASLGGVLERTYS